MLHVYVPAVGVLKVSPRGGSEALGRTWIPRLQSEFCAFTGDLKILGSVSGESRPSVEGGNDF